MQCKRAQLRPSLGDPMDCSPPGSSVHGISQARILDWVTISYSRGIFLTHGSNPRLLHVLHWQADSLSLTARHPARTMVFLFWPPNLIFPILTSSPTFSMNCCPWFDLTVGKKNKKQKPIRSQDDNLLSKGGWEDHCGVQWQQKASERKGHWLEGVWRVSKKVAGGLPWWSSG